MSDDRLFDVPTLVVEDTEVLSAGRQLTLRNSIALATGKHPANGLPLDHAHRCGDCVHLHRYDHHSHTYLKCPNHRLGESHSASSDIRASWPACPKFEVAS